MKAYYLELIDKAKEWAYVNLNFQNGYHNDLFVITCENKNAKNMAELFDQGYDDIDSERVY